MKECLRKSKGETKRRGVQGGGRGRCAREGNESRPSHPHTFLPIMPPCTLPSDRSERARPPADPGARLRLDDFLPIFGRSRLRSHTSPGPSR